MKNYIFSAAMTLHSVLFGLSLSHPQPVNALASTTFKYSLNQHPIETTVKRGLISQANQTSYQTNYARSISDVRDVRPTDWAFTALQSAIERYGVVRLYSDGSFAGNENATRAEMIDSMGHLLDLLLTSAAKCKLSRPNFPFTPSVSSDQFYYGSYEVIARATGVSNLLYSQGGGDKNANQSLTRADVAVIIRRYFAEPLNNAMGVSFNSKSLYKSIANYLGYQSKTQIAQNITSVVQISDIRPDDPFYEDVRFMVEVWGSLSAYPDRTFRPRKSISRYELIGQLIATADKGNEIISSVCANNQSSVESNEVTIVNNTNIDILYSLNGKDYSLSSGQIGVHKGEDFNVEFDSSLMSGYQRVSYPLKPDSVNRFRKNGDQIDLLYD